MKVLVVFLILLIVASCSESKDLNGEIGYVDSVKLFESFKMKKEYDKIIENDLSNEAMLLDSLNVLMETAADSSKLFRLRKDYYVAEQMYNSKLEKFSSRYTKMVSDRLNEYVKTYSIKNNLNMVLSGSGGSILYVKDRIDLTDEVIEFVNNEFEN